MKQKKKIILIGLVILVVIILSFVIFKMINKNSKLLEETKSLVTLQSEYEDDLKAKGYSIDNPNVVVDPYKASP